MVELIIAVAISLLVATAMVEIVLTAARASNVAFGRIEASSQVRAFEMRAADDFASSSLPAIPPTCGSQATPCHTTPIVLNGPTPTVPSYQVTYVWDGSAYLDRQVAGASTHLGTSVTGFSWYEDSATRTVIIELTVTVQSYSESQTFRFYPRLSP